MGISKSTYCGYETGKRQPDALKIKQLSRFLGVSGDDLLETGFSASQKRNDYGADSEMTSAERQMLKMYRLLDERGKAAVLNTLNHEYESYIGEDVQTSAKEA